VTQAERRLAAIVSGDLVGYSRRMAEDEEATVHAVQAHRARTAELAAAHRGRLVDFTGDNFLAEFPSALDAARFAVELQAENESGPAEPDLRFRLGVHLGDVRFEEERLYGDGVNIAARLEGLAEPGGVCVSGVVHEQIERRLDASFEDLGERELKNIPKQQRVYRLRSGVRPADDPAPAELTVAGFSGPAIAVLPFDNLSGDPEQQYFADGIAEDLITRLSCWRAYPVIARNSSFAYRGQSVDVKRVSRELGVRYVIEGSVRRAGDRVRVSAQLIDATTGHHVWAERYDRKLEDVFALQDEIIEAIVGSAVPEGAERPPYGQSGTPRSSTLTIFSRPLQVPIERSLPSKSPIEVNLKVPRTFAGFTL
jgi:TolB-like protein/class 3 adenylate cyclase